MLKSLRSLAGTATLACACAATAVTFSLPATAHAQASADAAKLDAHPASKVVREYLQLMLQREWAKSAALVEPDSLKQLVKDYVEKLKRAPTMDDEEAMCQRVGKSSVDDVAAMAPVDFYVAYHQGIQERYKVPPEVIKKVRETLTLKLLSIAQEDDSHVHILVRTRHNNDKAVFESLELVSLVKVDGAWKVGLNEQAPRVTPLDPAAGAGAAPAPAAAATDDKPADTPAKPTKPKGKTK